jgi:cbb3-type cytochrome oxidase subunit 3
MFQQFFQDSSLLMWPLVGLAVFLLSFIAVLLHVTFGLRDRRKRDHIASLPLDDENGGASR